MPNSSIRDHLYRTLFFAVPVARRDGPPDSGRIFGNDREVRQTLAFEARSSHLPGVAWWSQFVKSSIQGQAAYEGDRLSQMSAAVQELQGSVSEIVAVADLSVWVPAPHQKK